jgi:multidrug efflux system outer membrane protein
VNMKTILRSTALFAALVLAGCASVGPDYHAPKEAPVTLQGVDPAQQTSEAFQAQWWKQFGDPTLDSLIVRAAQGSPDLRIAVARLKQARAALGTAKSQQIPDIETGVDYSRAREQQPGFTDQRQTITSYQAGFDASWELDLFGGIRRSVEAARADAGAGEASLQDAQVTLFAEVARNYFDLRGTQLRIDVAKRDITNQQDSLKVINARVEVGTGAEQDLASAKARLASVEAQLPVLETQAQADQFRIAVLLGARPGELDIDLSAATFKPIDVSLAIGGADEVLQRRPDIRIAERELAAANARIGVAKADYFPHITLGGFVGFLAGRSNDFGGADSRAWQLAPSISWSGLNVREGCACTGRRGAGQLRPHGAYRPGGRRQFTGRLQPATHTRREARGAGQGKPPRRGTGQAPLRRRPHGLPRTPRCRTHAAFGRRPARGSRSRHQHPRRVAVQGARWWLAGLRQQRV